MDTEDKLIDVHKACALLGVSRDTLYERRKAGIIQSMPGTNRTVRFWRSEVMRCAADPSAISPGPGPHSPEATPVAKPAPDDVWARCVAECKRLGISPDDRAAISAVMNRLYADEEQAAAWDQFEAKR